MTIRRAVALTGTVLFGASLGAVCGFANAPRILGRALALGVALSVVWVIVFPTYGVHQPYEWIEARHAGKWRGLWTHKNGLGAIAGIAFVVLLTYGREIFAHWAMRWGALAATALCLVKAQSSTGLAIGLGVGALALCLRFIALQPTRFRISLIAGLAFVVGLLAAFGPALISAILTLLGRDPTFTGRTMLWHFILQMMEGHWPLGYGFYSGYVQVDRMINEVNPGQAWGSTHNGYLDILVSLGMVGLTIILAGLAFLAVAALRKLLSPRHGGASSLPFAIVVFAAAHNFVESSIITPNNVVPLLLGVAAGALAQDDATRQATLPRAARFAFRPAPKAGAAP